MSSKTDSSTPFITTTEAYAVVPDDNGDDYIQLTPYYSNTGMFVDLDKPAQRTVSSEFTHIPETRGLCWYDDFFENEDDDEDIVAVFDLDYKEMERYYSSLGWVGFAATSCFLPNLFGCLLLMGFPCYLNKNVRWNTRTQHVAITRDGIRFVHERRRTCWGLPSCDAGKHSRTIPFDKITDCDIIEPAGNTCLCVPNTLHSVNVHTSSSSSSDSDRRELTLVGLKDPVAFKKLVWAMKRSQQKVSSDPDAVAPKGNSSSSNKRLFDMQTVEEAVTAGGNSNENVTTLLRDIRDELRQHNRALHGDDMQQLPPPSVVEAIAEPMTFANVDLS